MFAYHYRVAFGNGGATLFFYTPQNVTIVVKIKVGNPTHLSDRSHLSIQTLSTQRSSSERKYTRNVHDVIRSSALDLAITKPFFGCCSVNTYRLLNTQFSENYEHQVLRLRSTLLRTSQTVCFAICDFYSIHLAFLVPTVCWKPKQISWIFKV